MFGMQVRVVIEGGIVEVIHNVTGVEIMSEGDKRGIMLSSSIHSDSISYNVADIVEMGSEKETMKAYRFIWKAL